MSDFPMAQWKDVLHIQNGRNQKGVQNPNGQYPIYGSGGLMGMASEFLCEAQSVIIGRKGTIDNPLFVEERFWNVDTAFGLVPNSSLAAKYLYYFCKTFNFKRLNKATTIPSLTKSDLLKVSMPIPPLEEQKRIAGILDEADRVRKKTQALIDKYDELAQSLFLDMFGDPVTNPKGWEVRELSDVATITSGSTPKGVDNHFDVHGEFPFYRVSDMNFPENGEWMNHHENRLSASSVRELKMKVIPPGSVIFPKRGGAIMTNKKRRVSIPSVTDLNVMAITAKEPMLAPFLYAQFCLFDLGSMCDGSSVPQLNNKQIAPIRLMIPPMVGQIDFAARLSCIEEQNSVAKLKFVEAEKLFNALLQKAFKGELN